jgi:THO complex subunit 2
VSQWLQSLEAFSGAFFKRYPFVEFRGILAYLMRTLREGNVMELGILASLLKVAGGYGFADYSPAASLSATQLEGRAGSLTLKRETMAFGIVEDMDLRATNAIKQALQSDGIGVSMLILIAQARSRIIFESSKGTPKPVKLVGNLYDSCQVVISILLEFLTTEEVQGEENESGKAIGEYAKQLPPLDDLHFKYGLDVESSWMLCRPLLRAALQNKESDEVADPMKSLVVTETYSFRKKFESMLPEDAWSHLSPVLFESFYTNSLYDIFCPEDVYNAELNRVSKEVERLERAKAGSSSANQAGANPPKNEGVELVRLSKVTKLLTAEKEKQTVHVDGVRDEFEAKKDDLMNSDVASQQAAKALLLHCVYPRSLQSPDDAIYCAHFALQLHNMETPGFGTLHYIDELISVVAGSLFGLTEAEAANSAILLWQTWTTVNKWRYTEGLFEAEVSGKPGSYMEQLAAEQDDDRGDPQEISHKDFVALYSKWHATLGTALIGCLKSTEYIHTRTGLVALTRLVEVFPTRPKLGNRLIAALEPLQDEQGNRPDIRAAANAYCTMLLKARDDGKWMEEDASVAKARADKEKAAAEEKKKKFEEQFEELQRDSEKITEEIGPREGFERGRRGDARSFGGSRAAGPPASDRGRGSNLPPPNRETGEVTGRDTRRSADRRSPPRDGDRRRDRGQARGDPVVEPPARVGERHAADRGHREGGDRASSGRNDDREGRWVRGDAPPAADDGRSSRGAKRGRAPSPEPMDDRGGVKRPRLEPDNTFDSRREAGRAPSPARRGRGGGPESSRPSRARRSRR